MGLELHCAAKRGDLEKMNALLSSKTIQIDKRDPYGGTALHWASQSGNVNSIHFLCQNGADVSAIGKYDGNTTLHYAVESKNGEAVRVLISLGADPSLRNNAGLTPYDVASKSAPELLGILSQTPPKNSVEATMKQLERNPETRQYTNEFFSEGKLNQLRQDTSSFTPGTHLPEDNIYTRMRAEGQWTKPNRPVSPGAITNSPIGIGSPSSPRQNRANQLGPPSFHPCQQCASSKARLESLIGKERALEEREAQLKKHEEEVFRRLREVEERERSLVEKEAGLAEKVKRFKAIVEAQKKSQS